MQGGAPDLSFLAQVTAATGDEKNLLGTGETRYKAGLIASKRYGAFGPHLNVAYETSTGEDFLDNITYAAGFDVRISPKFTAGLDVLGRHNPDQEAVDSTVLDVALSAKWNPFKGRQRTAQRLCHRPGESRPWLAIGCRLRRWNRYRSLIEISGSRRYLQRRKRRLYVCHWALAAVLPRM